MSTRASFEDAATPGWRIEVPGEGVYPVVVDRVYGAVKETRRFRATVTLDRTHWGEGPNAVQALQSLNDHFSYLRRRVWFLAPTEATTAESLALLTGVMAIGGTYKAVSRDTREHLGDALQRLATILQDTDGAIHGVLGLDLLAAALQDDVFVRAVEKALARWA